MAGKLYGGFGHGDASAANIATQGNGGTNEGSPYAINGATSNRAGDPPPNTRGSIATDTTKAKKPIVPLTPKVDTTMSPPTGTDEDIFFSTKKHRKPQTDDDTDTVPDTSPESVRQTAPPLDNSNKILGGIGNEEHDRDVRARQDSVRKANAPVRKGRSSGGIH